MGVRNMKNVGNPNQLRTHLYIYNKLPDYVVAVPNCLSIFKARTFGAQDSFWPLEIPLEMCQKNAIKNAIMVRPKAGIAHAARPEIESRVWMGFRYPSLLIFASCSRRLKCTP